MKKIGILGGSFNPIHKAHVEIALKAIEIAKLDEFIIIPTYITNLKDNSILVSSEDRFNMCKLACQSHKELQVSDIEIKRHNVSYTSDTIKELLNSEEASYYLVMGADSYVNLSKWHNYEYILNNCTIVICPRGDEDYEGLLELSHTYDGYKPIIMKHSISNMSSTLIRKMIKNNDDISAYLDDKVIEYIKKNNLYKDKYDC